MVSPNKFRHLVASGKSAVAALCLVACTPTLSGSLVSPEGELVTVKEAKVNVVRLDSEGAGSSEPKTLVITVDSDGKFSTTESLEPGEYLIEALAPGYKLASKRVTLSEADGLQLTLEPLPAVQPSAVGANTTIDLGRGSGSAQLTPPNL